MSESHHTLAKQRRRTHSTRGTSHMEPELTPEEKSILEYRHFRSVIDDVEYRERHRQYNDDKDRSVNPSYTNFTLPYDWIAWTRYKRNKVAYEEQFRREIHMLINHSGSALDALLFAKHMAITTLWPPYHNPKEQVRSERFFHFKGKQRERLNKLLNGNR